MVKKKLDAVMVILGVVLVYWLATTQFTYSGALIAGPVIDQYQENADQVSIGVITGNIGVLNVNYTKPVDSIGALWQVKHGKNNPTYNITLPIACFTQSPLELRIQSKYSYPVANSWSQPQCFDGSGWIDIGTRNYVLSGGQGCGGANWVVNTNSRLTDGDWNTNSRYMEGCSNLWYSNTVSGTNDYAAAIYEEAVIWQIQTYLPSTSGYTITNGEASGCNPPAGWVNFNNAFDDNQVTYMNVNPGCEESFAYAVVDSSILSNPEVNVSYYINRVHPGPPVTYSGGWISVYCTDSIGTKIGSDFISITSTFEDSSKQTKVPSSCLQPDGKYYLTLYGTGDGIPSEVRVKEFSITGTPVTPPPSGGGGSSGSSSQVVTQVQNEVAQPIQEEDNSNIKIIGFIVLGAAALLFLRKKK